MINSTDVVKPPVPIKTPESAEKTPRGNLPHGPQSHDAVPYLESADGGTKEQQVVSLSSRTITDLTLPLNHLHLENTPSSTTPDRQGLPEAGGGNEQDIRPTIAPREPYPGTPEDTGWNMNNNPPGNYCARYVNIPQTDVKTVRIGNQDLITLDTSQPFVDSTRMLNRGFAEVFNFSFLADFLSKNDKIEHIVDIGCGSGDFSLFMQSYLNELGCQITVIPVDVANFYTGLEGHSKPIPINILPAQEIADASPSTTLFTAINPQTSSLLSEARRLNREIAEGTTDYFLTTLIKNNPDCFVLVTEGYNRSGPQDYIPPELVYTKHYNVFANPLASGFEDSRGYRLAKAEAMNGENGYFYRLNQLLAKLPEQRDSYLDSIAAIKDSLLLSMLREPEASWPDVIFGKYQENWLTRMGAESFEETASILKKDGLEIDCWHVYRWDAKATEFQTANPPARIQPEREIEGFLDYFCEIL
ncbi:hypothetical protein [Endozoicomonas sp. ONNA2]|uniref:hypothetical protein n=1 Tax=Endozoicomonas sp. ONNA2 TaxID=2828741 RepID=UPI002148CCE6|nr:hypothetical protein [Endozoicomonas sp. ONNA2]